MWGVSVCEEVKHRLYFFSPPDVERERAGSCKGGDLHYFYTVNTEGGTYLIGRPGVIDNPGRLTHPRGE